MIHKIKSLHDNGHGLSIRAISKELSVSRNTVRKYLQLSEDKIQSRQSDPSRTKKLDAYRDYLVYLLGEFPKLSAVKVARKLRHKYGLIPASDRSLRRYIQQLRQEVAVAQADFSEVKRLAADETSRSRGHDYVTLVADADARRVLFVTEGRDAATIKAFAEDFTAHGGDPQAIESISIDMSSAFIKGVTANLPNATITFDKFHVIAHASTAVDKMRRIEQRTDPELKGLRWKLLKGKR